MTNIELQKLKTELLTQNNKMTSHPIFCVQFKYKTNSYDNVWKTKQMFFTNNQAKKYMDSLIYAQGTVRIYIQSGYDNPQWKAIRNYFMTLKI